MIVVLYDSLTGQGKRFALKTQLPCHSIEDYQPHPDHQIILVTRSHKFGEIPPSTISFIDSYLSQIIGIAVTGNRNWGANFGKAGDKIQSLYHIPLILKFEMSGTPKDLETLMTWVKKYQGD